MEALTHQQEREGIALLERRGGAGRAVRGRRGCQGSSREKAPGKETAQMNIQWPKMDCLIAQTSDVQNMRMGSEIDALQRDLHICGLRSRIRATGQKVNFWSTPKASLNKLKF
jgi:hypothetical protein